MQRAVTVLVVSATIRQRHGASEQVCGPHLPDRSGAGHTHRHPQARIAVNVLPEAPAEADAASWIHVLPSWRARASHPASLGRMGQLACGRLRG